MGDDGKVDRKKLGKIVFASPVERANLEHLVFPYIEKRIREELAKAQADPKAAFVVLDAAIMLEAGWNKECTWIVYIHAPRAERLRRVQEDRGWSEKEVEAREGAQMSLTEKASRADFAVDNSQAPDDLAGQLDALLSRLGLAK